MSNANSARRPHEILTWSHQVKHCSKLSQGCFLAFMQLEPMLIEVVRLVDIFETMARYMGTHIFPSLVHHSDTEDMNSLEHQAKVS